MIVLTLGVVFKHLTPLRTHRARSVKSRCQNVEMIFLYRLGEHHYIQKLGAARRHGTRTPIRIGNTNLPGSWISTTDISLGNLETQVGRCKALRL